MQAHITIVRLFNKDYGVEKEVVLQVTILRRLLNQKSSQRTEPKVEFPPVQTTRGSWSRARIYTVIKGLTLSSRPLTPPEPSPNSLAAIVPW